ncbi:MAG: VOC family protein [Pseudomonadota bacterium]
MSSDNTLASKPATRLNYLEFPSRDLVSTKAFFEEAFQWEFTDYGDEYSAFDSGVLDGGFFKSDQVASAKHGAALAVFYSDDLEASMTRIESLGGVITQAIFEFPGGRRFHFVEPGGNELAVWGDPVSQS